MVAAGKQKEVSRFLRPVMATCDYDNLQPAPLYWQVERHILVAYQEELRQKTCCSIPDIENKETTEGDGQPLINSRVYRQDDDGALKER